MKAIMAGAFMALSATAASVGGYPPRGDHKRDPDGRRKTVSPLLEAAGEQAIRDDYCRGNSIGGETKLRIAGAICAILWFEAYTHRL
jgi:hypothetical protein